jgi:type II secretory pathway predicted ATPase ExeA
MYLEHYGFTMKPFDKTPDPAFFYNSPVHEEALARLQYGTEEREFALLTGEIGTGKTLLSRTLMDTLPENYLPVLIVNPRLSPSQFLKTVAKQLGIDSPAYFRVDLLDQIHQALFRLYEDDTCPVIIIDEAQLIPSRSTYEEIRLLTNLQLDDMNLMALILIGQPELRKRIRHAGYEAVRQRIGIRYHLGPIGREDTGNYIAHRLVTAEGNSEIFSQEAVDVIFMYSGGLPRIINNIAANALLTGYSKDLSQIGPDIILDVVEDLDLEPV